MSKPTRKIILNDSYTIEASDDGMFLVFASDDPVTVTVPAGLGAEFECGLAQDGDGPVSLAAADPAALRNRQNHTKIAGKDALASLVAIAEDTLLLAGDTAP